MGRPARKVIAVSTDSLERREFATVYECAQFLWTSHANVTAALNRGGICCGWKLYDTPDTIRKRIEQLQEQLREMER